MNTASFRPTDEQTEILDKFGTGESVIVEALAGTGKTSSLKLLAESAPGRRGLLLSFNKAVAQEAKRRFPSSIECRTVHSIAFAAAGRPYADRLGRKPALTPAAAAKHLGQTAGFGTGPSALRPNKLIWLANLTVAKFIKDLTEDVELQHVDIPDTIRVKVQPKDIPQLRQAVLELARKVWQDTLDPNGQASRFTHDTYIKIWQLSQPRLDYDYILVDEAQDTDPVAAGIYAAQDEHTQLVLVGDAAQSIYAFRGAVSFLSDFDAEHRVPLTQSFRFGGEIADEANVWLDVIGSKLRVRGNPARDSWIDRIGRPHAVLCRSNAGAFQGFLESMNRGHAVALGGKGDEMKRFAEGAKTLQERHYSTHPDLMLFNSWAEARAYAETDPHGGDIAAAVKLVDKFGADAIIGGVDRATPEDRAQVVYGTAHSAKGREWDTVRIHNDFHAPADDKLGRARPVEKEDAMLAYVTVTRAKEGLDTGGLAYIHQHMRRLRAEALDRAS